MKTEKNSIVLFLSFEPSKQRNLAPKKSKEYWPGKMDHAWESVSTYWPIFMGSTTGVSSPNMSKNLKLTTKTEGPYDYARYSSSLKADEITFDVFGN
jgi:hypothetical protein